MRKILALILVGFGLATVASCGSSKGNCEALGGVEVYADNGATSNNDVLVKN